MSGDGGGGRIAYVSSMLTMCSRGSQYRVIPNPPRRPNVPIEAEKSVPGELSTGSLELEEENRSGRRDDRGQLNRKDGDGVFRGPVHPSDREVADDG